MTIAHLYNRSLVIHRLSTVSGNRKNFVSTGTYDAHIQRIDESSNPDAFSVYGATHKGWTDITNDIKVGDYITDDLGIRYEVLEVIAEGRGIAMNEHAELILKVHSS